MTARAGSGVCGSPACACQPYSPCPECEAWDAREAATDERLEVAMAAVGRTAHARAGAEVDAVRARVQLARATAAGEPVELEVARARWKEAEARLVEAGRALHWARQAALGIARDPAGS